MARLIPFTARKLNNSTSSGTNKPSMVCSICLDTITKQQVGQVDSVCEHLFCASCILQWFNSGKRICPLDRRNIRQIFVYESVENMNSHGICAIYKLHCKICSSSVNVLKSVTCVQCIDVFHHFCLGFKDEENVSQYLCLTCTKKPVHWRFCTCVRCCSGNDSIQHTRALSKKV